MSGWLEGHPGLPRLLVSTVPLTRDDVVVVATDGIRADFADHLTPGEPPQGLAEVKDRQWCVYLTQHGIGGLVSVEYIPRKIMCLTRLHA